MKVIRTTGRGARQTAELLAALEDRGGAALDAVLAGQPVSAEQKPSLGCNIKWKPGNEPDYFD